MLVCRAFLCDYGLYCGLLRQSGSIWRLEMAEKKLKIGQKYIVENPAIKIFIEKRQINSNKAFKNAVLYGPAFCSIKCIKSFYSVAIIPSKDELFPILMCVFKIKYFIDNK
jgi:hypothetical protein